MHDGPGLASQNMYKGKGLILPSTFQAFIVVFSKTSEIIIHIGNKHCVYNITAESGYVNLSIKSMKYRGPQFSGNFLRDGSAVVHCFQGGLAYEITRDDMNLKGRQFHSLCDTYPSKNLNNSSFRSSSYHNLIMDIISPSSSMILVVYSYEHYSEVKKSAPQ